MRQHIITLVAALVIIILGLVAIFLKFDQATPSVSNSSSLVTTFPSQVTPAPAKTFDNLDKGTETDNQALMAAIIAYNSNVTAEEYDLEIVGIVTGFARFNLTPKPGVDLDPAFGFAKKQDDTWTILNLGTGGDPTDLYAQYNIPSELRDAGY